MPRGNDSDGGDHQSRSSQGLRMRQGGSRGEGGGHGIVLRGNTWLLLGLLL